MWNKRILRRCAIVGVIVIRGFLATSSTATADAADRTKMALKLAGLVAFVANSCPQLKPDYARFKAALSALGSNVEALEKPEMKSGYLGYAAQYRTDVKTNCDRARQQFGSSGTTIPGLFGNR